MLEVGSGSQVPTFRNSTHLDPQVGPARNLGVRQHSVNIKGTHWEQEENEKSLFHLQSL
jgi:hypothetical protein